MSKVRPRPMFVGSRNVPVLAPIMNVSTGMWTIRPLESGAGKAIGHGHAYRARPAGMTTLGEVSKQPGDRR
jgi:hypothetical protein